MPVALLAAVLGVFSGAYAWGHDADDAAPNSAAAFDLVLGALVYVLDRSAEQVPLRSTPNLSQEPE